MIRKSQNLVLASCSIALILTAVQTCCSGQSLLVSDSEIDLDQSATTESSPFSLTVAGDVPEMLAVPSTAIQPNDSSEKIKAVVWQSSEFMHRPLVFEESQLERAGCAPHPRTQSLYSGARFFARAAIYPFYFSR